MLSPKQLKVNMTLFSLIKGMYVCNGRVKIKILKIPIRWVGGVGIDPIFHFVKLHSNLQTQLNFSWLEKELTLFSHGRRREGRRKKKKEPTPSFYQKE